MTRYRAATLAYAAAILLCVAVAAGVAYQVVTARPRHHHPRPQHAVVRSQRPVVTAAGRSQP